MNQPCPPFSNCWCQTHPTHPSCSGTQVPINSGLIFLMLAGVILACYYIKRNNKMWK